MAKRRSSRIDASSRPPLRGAGVPPRASNRNLLLTALPDADYARVGPMLDVVSPKVKVVLHRPGDAVHHVFFPGAGFRSELTVLAAKDALPALRRALGDPSPNVRRLAQRAIETIQAR